MTHSSWIRTFIVFFSLSLFWGPVQAARIEPLYTPLPLDVDRGFTLSEVREAISDSLINTGWHEQRSQGNEVRASRSKGRHTGHIGISYSSSLIEFHHLGSEGLSATSIDGVEYIHGLYNSWVHDLDNALKFRINQLALEHDRYGGKAPVSEVEIRPGGHEAPTIKRGSETEVQEIRTEVETTPMEPVDVESVTEPGMEQDTPQQGVAVDDAIVKPEAGDTSSAVPLQAEPDRTTSPVSAGKQTPEIKAVETPEKPVSTAQELPPADAEPARPADSSRDLGELKW